MITSREEYEFVDIDAGIKINGEIMPLRTAARKNDLRGEDPAFLLEAQGERFAALWGFRTAKKKMTKEISGERLKDIVKGIQDSARLYDAENYGAYFIKEQLPDGDLYDLASDDVAKELGLTFADYDFSAKVWNFEPGGALRRSHMEKLFADADLMRIPCLYKFPTSNFIDEITVFLDIASGSIGGAAVPEYDDPNSQVLGRLIYYYEAYSHDYGQNGETDWRGMWAERTLAGGNLSYAVGADRAKWIRPITRTLCICSVSQSIYEGYSATPSVKGASSSYAVFSCPSSQADDVVTLDADSIAAGAKRLVEHYGFQKLALPFDGTQAAFVRLRHIIPVCEMGDHTRWQSDTGETT